MMKRREPNRYTDNEDGTVTIHIEDKDHNGDSIVDKDIHQKILELDNSACHIRTPPGYLNSSTVGYIHQFVMGEAPIGYEIDHINRNKLDNRRENLHFATKSENRRNLGRKKGRKWPRNIGYDLRSPNKPFLWQFQYEGRTKKKRGFVTLEEVVEDLKENYLRITGNIWTGDQ